MPSWWLGVGLLAAVVSLTVLATYPTVSRDMVDLRVYEWGGHIAWHTSHVYDLHYKGLPFTYTPMALLVFMATSVVPVPVLIVVVTWATLAALGFSLWLILGMAGFRRDAGRIGLALTLTAVAVWLEPVQQTLTFGQVNAVLMAMVLADVSLDDRQPGKGVLIGLAAGFKLVPGIFIAYLVVTRRFRAAAVAVTTVALSVAAGFALLPAESHRYWLDGLFANSSRVGPVDSVSNQSLQGLLVRTLKTGVADAHPYWLAIAVILCAVGMAVVARAARRGDELVAVLVTAVTGLLVSPISWSHHWVWAGPLLSALVALGWRYRSLLLWLLATALTGLFAAYPMHVGRHGRKPMGIIWSVPFRHHRELAWNGSQILVGNLYVWIGLLVIVATLAYTFLSPGRAALGTGDRATPTRQAVGPESTG